MELLQAAHDVPKPTMAERARLLQLAAAAIHDYRDEINYCEIPANDSGIPEEVVNFLIEAADFVDEFSDSEFSETILGHFGHKGSADPARGKEEDRAGQIDD